MGFFTPRNANGQFVKQQPLVPGPPASNDGPRPDLRKKSPSEITPASKVPRTDTQQSGESHPRSC